MKFWIFSDIHADVNRGYRLPARRPDCDAIIIAGDICEGAENAIRWIGAQKFGKPVIFVAGNHEYYRTSIASENERAKEAAAKLDRVHFLDKERIAFIAKGGREIQVIGATLWTDYRLDGDAWQSPAMFAAGAFMSDHTLIRNAGRRWRPMNALAEHEQAAAYLKTMIDTRKPGSATVVVTHHAPSRKSISPKYVKSGLNPAYASNLDDLACRANLWVHGHIHARSDYMIGDCRVVANPRGYVRYAESVDFDPSLVIEV